MPFSFSTSSDLPFNQTTVNPWDFLYCFCCGHYNSVLTSSSAFWLNSKCVYTPLLISEPEVNRQVKSQRRLGEFCIWAHLGGTCPLSHYREKLLHWRRLLDLDSWGQKGVEWVMSEENTECCGTEIQSAGLEAVRRPIRLAAGGWWRYTRTSILNVCV